MRFFGAALGAAVLVGVVSACGAEPEPADWVIEPPRNSSIGKLRREVHQNPEEDPVTLLGTPSSSAPAGPLPDLPPLYVNEPDRFFPTIIGQILAETGVLEEGNPSSGLAAQFAKEMREALGLRREM